MRNKKLVNFFIAKVIDILLLSILIFKSIGYLFGKFKFKNKNSIRYDTTNWNYDFKNTNKKSLLFRAEFKLVSFLLKNYPKEYIRRRKFRKFVSDFSYEMF